jgi:hypothetical protein
MSSTTAASAGGGIASNEWRDKLSALEKAHDSHVESIQHLQRDERSALT